MIESQDTLVNLLVNVDTLTNIQQVTLAYFYECKYVALGYSLIAMIFVIVTIICGMLYIKHKKHNHDFDGGELQGLYMMCMIIFFILSNLMFVVTVYKTTVYFVAKKSPIGAYELKHGNIKENIDNSSSPDTDKYQQPQLMF